MLGSRLRPLSAVEKQSLAGSQLASFLATFRVGLPSSLKLSLNWFFFLFVCFKTGSHCVSRLALNSLRPTLALPIECSGRSQMQSGC